MPALKHFFLFTAFCCWFTITAFAQADSSRYAFSILPQTHIVPLFTADTRAHRLSIQKPLDAAGYIGSMGGVFPVVSVKKGKREAQFSVASSVYTTLEKYTNRGYVVNVDFFVDFLLDLKLNENFTLRGGMGHTSQHLADDAVIAGKTPINYTRDYGQLFLVYTLPKRNFFVYGGGILNTSFRTDVNYQTQGMFQFGFEHAPLRWYDHNYLYYAGDIKFRGELDYGTTQNIQVGYKYARPSKNTFRLCFNYTSGYEERGQFYNQKRDFGTIAMYFDF